MMPREDLDGQQPAFKNASSNFFSFLLGTSAYHPPSRARFFLTLSAPSPFPAEKKGGKKGGGGVGGGIFIATLVFTLER